MLIEVIAFLNYIYSHLCETMDIHIVYMHVIQRAFNKQIT